MSPISHLGSPVLKAALQALYLTDLHLYISTQLLVLRGEVLEVRRPLVSILRPARTFKKYEYFVPYEQVGEQR